MKTKIPQKDAIQDAIDYGIDVTLLYAALKRTPTERLDINQKAMEDVDELRMAGEKKRAQKPITSL